MQSFIELNGHMIVTCRVGGNSNVFWLENMLSSQPREEVGKKQIEMYTGRTNLIIPTLFRAIQRSCQMSLILLPLNARFYCGRGTKPACDSESQ